MSLRSPQSKTIRGRITREYTAWCARCDEFVWSGRRRKASVAREIRAHGWSLTKADGWICPACKPPVKEEARRVRDDRPG